GVAVAAHRMAIEHAKQRETFGQKLSQRQAIQWMLADAEVELRACRWLIWEGAWKADRGEDARVEASIAKLYSSEVLGRVVDGGASRGCRRGGGGGGAGGRRWGGGPGGCPRVSRARPFSGGGGGGGGGAGGPGGRPGGGGGGGAISGPPT